MTEEVEVPSYDMELSILELVEIRKELYNHGKNVDIDNVMLVSFGGQSKDSWGKKFGNWVVNEFNHWRDNNRDVVILKKNISKIKMEDGAGLFGAKNFVCGKKHICHRILVAYAPFTPVNFPHQQAVVGDHQIRENEKI